VALTIPARPYAGLAEAWANGAALAYGPLARHLVARAPVPLAGARALDAGAGSGAAGDALRAGGARLVSADRELDMARYVAGPAVAADVLALPFRAGSFDLVVAAFVVNHLDDPVAGLAELRRVTRPGGAVLASTFSVDRAPAKDAIDRVAARHGFVTPGWYADLQACAHAVGGAPAVERAFAEAGFAGVTVVEQHVDLGLGDPEDVVRYRLSMPHLHGFVATLSAQEATALEAEAADAVRATGETFAPLVVEAVGVA
jgi:SAM-dependent methyltransferase